MLRRIVSLAGAPDDVGAEARNATTQTVAPRLTLDGFGTLRLAARDRPRRPARLRRARDRRVSAGLLRPGRCELAVNALVTGDRLAPLDLRP